MTLAIIITAVCMASCSGASKSTSESGMTAGTGMAGDGVIEKTLKLGSFNAIKSEAIVDIHFAQGAKRSVRVRATQNALDRTDISVAQSTLTIKEKSGVGRWKGDSDRLKITLFVTAPELKSLNNQGIMNFDADRMNSTGTDIRNTGIMKMKVEDIHDRGGDGTRIENKGQMKAVVRTVDARLLTLDNTGILAFDNTGIKGGLNLSNLGQLTFTGNVDGNTADISNKGRCNVTCAFKLTGDYSCNNSGELHINGDVKGKRATLKNSGIYRMNGSFNMTDSYTQTNSGQADSEGDVTANSISMTNSGLDKKKGKLKADRLSIDVNGQSRYEMSFTGGDARLDCSGIGNFEMALDCSSIEVNSNGQINVTLSGAADNMSLDGSGISNVNTSRLNKF